MVDDGMPKPILTETAVAPEIDSNLGQDICSGTQSCSLPLRERKLRLAVLSVCILGIIIILIVAFVLQLAGRLPGT